MAQVEIAVGTLTVKNFEPEAENLELSREALMSFSRLGELMIDAVPPDFLNDYFLLAAAQKHVTSITFESHGSYVLVLPGGAAPTFRQIRVALGSEVNYPEFCDGIVAFLFRVDLDESTKVELRFPAARIPYDFCLKLMQVSCLQKRPEKSHMQGFWFLRKLQLHRLLWKNINLHLHLRRGVKLPPHETLNLTANFLR